MDSAAERALRLVGELAALVAEMHAEGSGCGHRRYPESVATREYIRGCDCWDCRADALLDRLGVLAPPPAAPTDDDGDIPF